MEAGEGRSVWGVSADSGYWVASLVLGAPLLCASVSAGALLSLLFLFAPLAWLGSDARLSDTIWDMGDGWGLAWGGGLALLGGLVGFLSLWMWWWSRLKCEVALEEEGVTVRGVLRRRRVRWSEVTRAFVTGSEEASASSWALHLWTSTGALSLPSWQVTPEGDPSGRGELREQRFERFVGEVEARLKGAGRTLERGVPVSAVTDVSWPLRHLLLWPQRRWLVRRHAGLLDSLAPAYDHRAPLVSLRSAWLWRPAPWMGLLLGGALVGWVRWGTEAEAAPWALALGGVLMFVFVPLWNLLKGWLRRLQWSQALSPEMVIGESALPAELPARLVPAPGCVVELSQGRLRRPDGGVVRVDGVESVTYGPERGASLLAGSGMATPAWHMSVTLREAPGVSQEIFHNASVDVVRHGDLDGGYALFNWVMARELASAAKARLTLAQGKVSPSELGVPLVERLQRAATRYDPALLEAERAAVAPSLRVESGPARFVVWGPLWRQPEGCATPPLWTALAALAALALASTGLLFGGLLAGYLGAQVVHRWLTLQHFVRPGFVLDKDGVWVRGARIGWGELEQSSLMPVSSGPLLFAGPRSLLVAGHLGASYAERAWLGCAAYRWIQDHVCEEGG